MAVRMNRCDIWTAAGFSYIWTLLLIVMMGIGMAATVDVYATSLRREREEELLYVGRQFQLAIKRYYEGKQVAGKHEHPTSLDDLLKDNRVPGTHRHLRKVFIDPITNSRKWGIIYVNGRLVGVHSLSSLKPIKQDGFESAESHFRGKQSYSEWVFTYPNGILEQQKPGTLGAGVVPTVVPVQEQNPMTDETEQQ